MTDAERDRYLRRLRFPDILEAAYQQDFYRQACPPMRNGLVVTVLMLILFTIKDHYTGFPDWFVFGFYGVWTVAFSLGWLALTFHKTLWRWQAAFIGLFAVCLPITLTAFSFWLRREYRETSISAALNHLIAMTMLIMAGELILMRAQWRWQSLLALMTSASSFITFHVVLNAPLGKMTQLFSDLVLPALIFLSFISFAQERQSRAAFLANHLLDLERARSENLLLNILPDPIAQRLKDRAGVIADNFGEVSVLFADIVDFTPLSARLSAGEIVSLLNEIFSAFDALAEKHGLEKIKTIGDAYMAVGGLPQPSPDHARAVAEMALDMQAAIARFRRDTGEALQLRVGINTGPVVAGVIGTKKFIYDLWGDTVNLASRMESQGSPGIIQVTEATCQQLGDRYVFGEAREIAVKGRGTMLTYALLARQGEIITSVTPVSVRPPVETNSAVVSGRA